MKDPGGGAIKKWGSPVAGGSGRGHMMGSCRMGSDAKMSVVDRWHEAHDVPNLFIVGGSRFVQRAQSPDVYH
jgi:choline dehydrogenase-like flavoprotein